ncbi:MAG TPA: hypothetical protein VFA10_10170 [Ktedonobacteraceae bacterium]|nr:hypothetical protein [Ktedonobacteraceae bacterium]
MSFHMIDQSIHRSTGMKATNRISTGVSILLFGILLVACTSSPPSTNPSSQHNSSSNITSNSPIQPITYSTHPHDVLIRTFYGGGLYGSLSFGPNISIYGDGTYLLGIDRQGKLSTKDLQQLLYRIVDTYGLLNFHQRQFADIQDQDATFLELALNGKQIEFMYGSFGNQPESTQAMDEYHRLEKALKAITEALHGPTQPYRGTSVALLARQTFSPDLTKTIPQWSLPDFSLSQVAVYECGVIPTDETSRNAEIGCLNYTIPKNALLLTESQLKAIKAQLQNQQQGTFSERGIYYSVFLRPLLPDELINKTLAMFGSAQGGFQGVTLLVGKVPPAPTSA